MRELIGLTQTEAENILKEKKLEYTICENNILSNADTKLVTGVREENGVVVLVVGSFIFDLKKEH